MACATIAVPACCSTWARDRFAVSAAKSASWMRLREAVMFWLPVCTFVIVCEKRFCTAPSWARVVSIVCSAASRAVSAALEPATVETSMALTAVPVPAIAVVLFRPPACAKTTLPLVPIGAE